MGVIRDVITGMMARTSPMCTPWVGVRVRITGTIRHTKTIARASMIWAITSIVEMVMIRERDFVCMWLVYHVFEDKLSTVIR